MSGGLPKDWEKTTQKYINELQANPAKIATHRLAKIRLTLAGHCCRSWRLQRIWLQQPDHLERFCFAEGRSGGQLHSLRGCVNLA
ncbi:hypothetical protein ACLB1E_15615 [Escherichia coli]